MAMPSHLPGGGASTQPDSFLSSPLNSAFQAPAITQGAACFFVIFVPWPGVILSLLPSGNCCSICLLLSYAVGSSIPLQGLKASICHLPCRCIPGLGSQAP